MYYAQSTEFNCVNCLLTNCPYFSCLAGGILLTSPLLNTVHNIFSGVCHSVFLDLLTDRTCGFEDEKICGFSQDSSDNFDWTRQNALTQNPKRSPNTGPTKDRSGSSEGYYMYIEASRPRMQGDKARLLSPLYNNTGVRTSFKNTYCVSFYYHMFGKHIGKWR
ncbi:MDGA1 protein, partial [Polypterus senegalus]|nr:MDGA1 protein [Polypterus senegalus]